MADQPESRPFDLVTLEKFRAIAGGQNEHFKLITRRTGVQLGGRGATVILSGQPAQMRFVETLLAQLADLVATGYQLYPEDIDQAMRLLSADASTKLRDYFLDTVIVSASHRHIAPKSPAQKKYIEAIRNQDIVFGVGPAGTGKTYLAMGMAVAALMERKVKRIVLCRPAVEAGEKLGFLPGDIAEKVNPYLRPLYDALHDMMDFERARQLVERGTVEVAPLAFMRGRTLNDAFVILDEAQNATGDQMKMFLTRLGYSSKAVVTGDITQTDLPAGRTSGLADAQRILAGIDGISFCQFSDLDVVRHPLVQEVIRAYQRATRVP